MEHKVDIQETTSDREVIVVCSCGFKVHATESQTRSMSATKVADEIASDHVIAAEFKELLSKDRHVILPKEPTNASIVLLGFDYRNPVPDLIEQYKNVTKLGKTLPDLVAKLRK